MARVDVSKGKSTGLVLAIGFNIVFGAIFVMAAFGLAAESMSLGAAAFFGFCGTLMTAGGVGLWFGHEWARRWAVVGLGTMVAINALACLVLTIGVVSVGLPVAPALGACVVFTALQTLALFKIRGRQAHDHVWEATEAAIEVAPHEVAFEFEEEHSEVPEPNAAEARR